MNSLHIDSKAKVSYLKITEGHVENNGTIELIYATTNNVKVTNNGSIDHAHATKADAENLNKAENAKTENVTFDYDENTEQNGDADVYHHITLAEATAAGTELKGDKGLTRDSNGTVTATSATVNESGKVETNLDSIGADKASAAQGKVVKVGDTSLNLSLVEFRDAWNDSTNDYYDEVHAVSYYSLIGDSNMLGYDWIEFIGNSDCPFHGTFDGNNYTISNLSNDGLSSTEILVNHTTGNAGSTFGLFGVTSGETTISNLNVSVNAYSDSGNGWGAIVAQAKKDNMSLTLSNITVSGILSGSDKAGGLVGDASGKNVTLTFENCTNKASVTGDRAAGIAACVQNAASVTFDNCINEGTITSINSIYCLAAGISCQVTASTLHYSSCENKGVLDASIAYNLFTGAFIDVNGVKYTYKNTSNALATDTYTYTGLNYNLQANYNCFIGGAYSASTAVDWAQVVRTSNGNDIIGMNAGIWYDTENADDYVITVSGGYEGWDGFTRYFKSLDETLSHNIANSTIKLSNDQTQSVYKSGQMTYSIDFNNNTLTASNFIHKGIDGGTITAKNGTIVQNCGTLFTITDQGTLKLDNVTLNSAGKCIATIESAFTGTIVATNSNISGYIDLTGNSNTKLVYNGTTYSQTDGRYIVITNGVATQTSSLN